MRTYLSPQRGHCASCEGEIIGQPIYRMDEIYCCVGCANFGPCICSYEADLADDGVDGLGLPFALPERVDSDEMSTSARIDQTTTSR